MFRNRQDAGRQLAAKLDAYRASPNAIVLALPRGGVPVGFEIARALKLPLDVFVVRKLGTPGQPELAMGAIASGGVRVLNRDVVDALAIPAELIDRIALLEGEELARRERQYRGDRPRLAARGRTVLLVDDGLATGSTMRAAVAALRQECADKIVVAVPVGAQSSCELLAREADEIVCPVMPEPFWAVGQWYENFDQTSDEEVHSLLSNP